MASPVLNHHDFEYLTVSDQEYLLSIQRLYLLNSGKLKHFHTLGPWHQVKARQLNKIVERVATPNPRPCSRGHVKGLWCVEDPDYIGGPKILKYHNLLETFDESEAGTSGSVLNSSTESKSPKPPKTPKNKYSIPRKYQVIPKPSPWIIMEPSKKKNFICDDPPDPSYNRGKSASLPRSAMSRHTVGKLRVRPNTSAGERYTMSPYSTSVSPDELEHIVERVTRPTHASKGGVDLQEKFR